MFNFNSMENNNHTIHGQLSDQHEIKKGKEVFEIILIVIRNVGDIVLVTFKFLEKFVF